MKKSLLVLLLFTGLVAAIELLHDFVSKNFQTDLIVKLDEIPGSMAVSALTLGGNRVAAERSEAAGWILQGTYFSALVLTSEKNTRVEVNVSVADQDISRTLEFTADRRQYVLDDLFHSRRSAIPVLDRIINWSGDAGFLSTAIKYWLKYLVAALLLIGLLYALGRLARRQGYVLIEYGKPPSLAIDSGVRSAWLVIAACVLAYSSIVMFRSGFDKDILLINMFYRVLFDGLLFSTLAAFLMLLTRSRLLVSLFGFFYVWLIMQDAAVYYYGNTVFEGEHLKLIESYSLASFISLESSVLVLGFVAAGGYTAVRLYRYFVHIRWPFAVISAGLLLVVNLVDLPSAYSTLRQSMQFSAVDRFALKLQSDQVRYSMQNSLLNFVDEVIVLGGHQEPDLIHDLASYKESIHRYGIGIGKRQYESLPVQPFRKIVLITTESLSLDMLKTHNPAVPLQNSGFYGSSRVKQQTYTNYRTSAHNTLQGLVVSFNSHPNFSLLTRPDKRYFDNALPNVLRRHGYDTMFIRSASRYYANENVYFRELGFERIVAREDFEKTHAALVKGWGAYDRLLYEEAIKQLRAAGDGKLFINILGVDTHPPVGRTDFSPLDYGAVPDAVQAADSPVELFAASIWHHDHDVGRFIDRLDEEGLFDEETLVILTADHASPLNNVVSAVQDYPQTSLARIPLVFLSKADMPPQKFDQLASQLDLAPSVLHLLGIEVPSGYWGDSLFSYRKQPAFIGFDRGNYYIDSDGKSYVISQDGPDGDVQSGFLDLVNAIHKDQK